MRTRTEDLLLAPETFRSWARAAADALTWLRLAIALFIPWSGGLRGPVQMNLLGWSADLLDGPLARYSHTPASRSGGLDLAIDTVFTWTTAIGLARLGYLPGLGLAIWAAISLVG